MSNDGKSIQSIEKVEKVKKVMIDGQISEKWSNIQKMVQHSQPSDLHIQLEMNVHIQLETNL